MKIILLYLRRFLSLYVYRPISLIKYKFIYHHIPPTDKEIIISISDIEAWYRGNRYDELTFRGEIDGGNWERKLTLKEEMLNSSSKYKSIIQRYEKEYSWRETDIFKNFYKKRFLNNQKVMGCQTIDELETYYKENYDKLFESIKKNGIISNNAGGNFEPIYILIGPKGELYYTVDGNHRLAMCFVLGYDKIPVKVWKRHKKWQEIREKILSNNKDEIPSKYLEYTRHPDIITEKAQLK